MTALLPFPNPNSIPHSALNTPHSLGSAFPVPHSALPPRRTGKIARLPKATRDRINHMLDENVPYHTIIAELGETGKDLNPQNLSNWAQGGYQDYLRHQDTLDLLKDQLEFATDLLAQVPDPSAIFQALRHMAGLQLGRVLFENGQKLAETDPAAYSRLVRTICSLSSAERQYCQDRLRQAPVQSVPAKRLDCTRPLNERETQLIKAKLDEMCGFPAAPAPAIKADQASVVEVRFQRAGEGGFQPPVPVPSTSSSIKPDQTSSHPAGTCPTSSPTMSAATSASEIKVDQAPLVEVRFQRAGEGSFQPPVPASTASNSIKVDQTAAPSLRPKVQSSTSELQGSNLATPGSQPSTPLEHCLRCAEPLPGLLPNGQRPDHYCKCGQPLNCPPGTSLREHCPHCGVLQPIHGYNAFRRSDSCWNCSGTLPRLDSKSRTPWLPPARSVASAPK